jgi:DNA-binding protein YbaB
MLDKLKDMAAMRKQAGEMKKVMEQEKVTVETYHGKIKIVMNGSQDVEELSIDPEVLSSENKDKIENELIEGLKKATKEIQQTMARKAMSGEINLPF